MDAAVERRMLVRTTWASHVRSRGMDASTDRTVVRFILGKPRPEWERRVALEMQGMSTTWMKSRASEYLSESILSESQYWGT